MLSVRDKIHSQGNVVGAYCGNELERQGGRGLFEELSEVV
jgi:hypothetical protein